MSYAIIRFFGNNPSKVIKRGLTLEEAKDHCKNPETSSRTATSATAKARTKRMGAWFDGFREEE